MKIIYTKKELRQQLSKQSNQQIGFVPTMGFLHEGHMSLVKTAREENKLVVMSIFVNPLQFGPNEDFDQYPRDEAQDAEKAAAAGVDILFIPSVEEMYPTRQKLAMTFTEGADVLCGRSRPTHFAGVATVLSKLFHLVEPTRVYFGLKDAQQFALVHTLVEQLDFPIDLVGLETVREEDGLARSSRNVYLSDIERTEASVLHQALEVGRQMIEKGNKGPRIIEQEVENFILQQMPHATIDYVSMLSYPALAEICQVKEQIILAAAVQFQKARLIDNVIVMPTGEKQYKIVWQHHVEEK